MSFNSTSSSDAALPHNLPASSNFSLLPVSFLCLQHTTSLISFTAFSVTNILLLLPLCTFILSFGLKQHLKRRSTSMSHSDMFTYHMVTMETLGIVGCGLHCCGAWVGEPWLILVGVYVFIATSNGQTFFHILTCAERHLAVVHPILYLGLRKRGGVRIRNLTIACVWLLYLGLFALIKLAADVSTVPFLCLLALTITAVTFCSLSVLHALIRPGPGEGGGTRGRDDKTKVRAFHTITVILGALLVRFGGQVLGLVLFIFSALSAEVRCGFMVSGVWFNLPSSLVLPLQFLHRAGKLCCKNNNQPEDSGASQASV